MISGDAMRDVSQGVFLKFHGFSAYTATPTGRCLSRGRRRKVTRRDHGRAQPRNAATRDELYGHPDVTAQSFAGGVITELSWWLRTEPAMSPEALAQALIDVTPRDFKD